MTTPDEPSCRLIARLYNTRHEISHYADAAQVPGFGRSPDQRLATARNLLARARRAIAREPGLALPATFEPTREGADAAMLEAAAALDVVSARYKARIE